MDFTIETAAFADAVGNAHRIAPSKGDAFDKAAGIRLELTDGNLVVKATDLETTFLQRMHPTSTSGEGIARLPSKVFAGLMNTAPLGGETTVSIDADNKQALIEYGKAKSKLSLISNDPYPVFGPIDPTLPMSNVVNFAVVAKQISWATARDRAPLTGVHMDGESVMACNRDLLAAVPLEMPVSKPITVPLSAMSSVMNRTDEVRLRAEDSRLLVMADDDTELTTVIFADEYPNVAALAAKKAQASTVAEVEVKALDEVLGRMMVLVGGDRFPRIKLTFHPDERLEIEMDVPDLGATSDEVPYWIASPIDAPHVLHFSPVSLRKSANSVEGEVVSIGFEAGNPMTPLHFFDDAGFSCIAAPMRAT